MYHARATLEERHLDVQLGRAMGRGGRCSLLEAAEAEGHGQYLTFDFRFSSAGCSYEYHRMTLLGEGHIPRSMIGVCVCFQPAWKGEESFLVIL